MTQKSSRLGSHLGLYNHQPTALNPGARLGPYEIVNAIGAGGMGQVYRAKDTRLDRTVAVKVLPEDLAADPQFRERFEREARSISALNHPNICTLYDVGHDHGVAYLVMEYLEGQTLATRLLKGALPLPDALRIATEIASALDNAHRHGIVHRDLKPGNIMLAKAAAGRGGSSQAKLVDFGLARTGSAGAVPDTTPTAMATAPLTARGTILGTFQYMAPEQLEGDPADARTDIFAFGAVLFEMVTGRRAFEGKSQASLMSAILKDEPPPVSQVQHVAPPTLDHVVATCLAKSPDDRYQTAHDLLLELRWIAEGGSGVTRVPVATRQPAHRWLGWIAAAILGLVCVGASLVAVRHFREAPRTADLVEFSVTAPQNTSFAAESLFEVSPDGRQIVFAASSENVSRLWVRPLATVVAHPIPGTEGAMYPFWKPDSQSVGFFADGKLKVVALNGEPPVPLCEAPAGRGGAWSRDGIILFGSRIQGSQGQPLQRVAADGGVSVPATTLTKGDTGHRNPSFLPDGRHFLYVAVNNATSDLRLGAVGDDHTLSIGPTQSQGVYAAGHVLFVRGGRLLALPFDLQAPKVTGSPITVFDQVQSYPAEGGTGRWLFSVSETGVMAFVRGGFVPAGRLMWFDRTGRPLGSVGDVALYANLGLSADGKRLAAVMDSGPLANRNRDIWVLDTAGGGTPTRLTTDPAAEGDPIWSEDGREIIFNSERTGGVWSLFRRPSNPNGPDVKLLSVGANISAPDWSSDGRFVAYTLAGGATGADLWVLELASGRKKAFRQTSFNEDDPAFSPNGRWMAYNSDENNRSEVYLQSFPNGGDPIPVSRAGGWAPKWNADGSELFFLALDGVMMSATMHETPDGIAAAEPVPLFPTALEQTAGHHTYVVSRDGRRFLYWVRQLPPPIPSFTVLLNWPATLRE